MTQTIQHTETMQSIFTLPEGAGVLVSLAHPDDEFLIGGLLEQFRQKAIPTYAVIATDGEASDRGDPEALRNYARRYEAGKALVKYGVRMEDQHYLGIPDGQMSRPEHTAAVADAIGRLLCEFSIHTIVTLGNNGYDNHADHRATHTAAALAVAAHADDNPELRVYGLTRNDTEHQVPADPALKLRRLAHHKSQFDIDVTNPNYQPAPGTVEQPGIRLSESSRRNLDRYFFNMSVERYEAFDAVIA